MADRTRAYTANVIGEEILDYDLPVGCVPERLGETGIVVLHGGYEGATVVLAAKSDDEAVAEIEKAFAPDTVTVDDLDYTVDEGETLALIARVTGQGVTLAPDAADRVADALELLAGVDEGENTDYDDLQALAKTIREQLDHLA